MTDGKFNPEELSKLQHALDTDRRDAEIEGGLLEADTVPNGYAGLHMANVALSRVLDVPAEAQNPDDILETLESVLPLVEEFKDYLEQNVETHIVEINLPRDKVIEYRKSIIEMLKQKGTEDPTSIGLGWRKTIYGKSFQDGLMSRGAELWYPGVVQPTPTFSMDTPLHINLIEDPDVVHEPRRIYLMEDGRASTSASVDSNVPDESMWLGIIKDMKPEEWDKVLHTVSGELKSA